MPALAILIRFWRPILAVVSVLGLLGGAWGYVEKVKHDAYVAGYAAGYAKARAEDEAAMRAQEAANQRAISEAAKKLDAVTRELELKDLQVDDILKALDLAADAAPDAGSCGLDADGMRRLNSIG